MKSNPNGFAEPTIIGTESEARKYAAQMGKPQTYSNQRSSDTFNSEDNLQEKAIELSTGQERSSQTSALMREYSLPYDFTDPTPPFPDMKVNICLVRWEPKNLDEFILKHGEEFKRMLAEKKEQQEGNLDGLVDVKKSRSTSQRRRSKTVKSNTQSDNSAGEIGQDSKVQSEHQCTDATAIPTADMPIVEVHDLIPETIGLNETKTSVPSKVTETGISEITDPQPFQKSEVVSDTSVSVEQSKKTRVSAKMIDADFDELSRKYLQITSLGEKKPVFLPLELRDALDAIARLSGDRRLSASHVAINVIRAFLNEHRELINRKLAGVKLSI
ncbi:MAG: DUF3408 domain-containing protein [Muribaculaceae bacterium]|nr:DUF3408 domain-containing protein [Muribaculaceae bacterium]